MRPDRIFLWLSQGDGAVSPCPVGGGDKAVLVNDGQPGGDSVDDRDQEVGVRICRIEGVRQPASFGVGAGRLGYCGHGGASIEAGARSRLPAAGGPEADASNASPYTPLALYVPDMFARAGGAVPGDHLA